MRRLLLLLLWRSLRVESLESDTLRYLKFERSHVEYGSTPGRRLQAGEWEPIRIYVDTSQLERSVTAAEFNYLRDDVLMAATRWLSLAVKVRPVAGSLQLEQHCDLVTSSGRRCVRVARDFQACGAATIPVEHFREKEYCENGKIAGCSISSGGPGIANADIALYVTSVDSSTCNGGGTVAYASMCRQDQADRPVAGFFNFCPSSVRVMQPGSPGELQHDVGVAIHEMLHVMGFSSYLFPFFRDDAGQPRTPRDQDGQPPFREDTYVASTNTVVKVVSADGSVVQNIVLPRVLKAAQEHFGCSAMDRMPLEEQGGDGSAFSHWESRIMYTEVMTAQVATFPRISDITLALLEDSGWYQCSGGAKGRGSSVAGFFQFGRGKGCSFVNDDCVSEGRTPWGDSFCTQSAGQCTNPRGVTGCSHDLAAAAYCTACIHDQAFPAKYQHFSDPRLGGDHVYMGYCPIWEPYLTRSGTSFCLHGDEYKAAITGETFGASSRCVLSTLVTTRYQTPAQASGSCRDIMCDGTGLHVRVGDTTWVPCSVAESGALKSVTGWRGQITCPDFSLACGSQGDEGPRAGVQCYIPSVLRHGRCVCAPGSIGEDCGVDDAEQNRPHYPHGLRYPLEELVLVAGTPVSQAPSVTIWPLRPDTSLGGPSQLQFTVLPPLPRGMKLQMTDGTISGTPTVGATRAPYTVRAAGGRGASTTTVFITVESSGGASPGPSTTGTETVFPGGTPAPPGQETAPAVFVPPDDSESLALDVGLLRLTLPSVKFQSIQLDPGLEAFAGQLAFEVSVPAGVHMAVAMIAASPSGSTLVDFGPTIESCKIHGADCLQALEQQLIEELFNQNSALLRSSFGQTYLLEVAVTRMSSDGVVQVWPKPKPKGEESGIDWKMWFDFENWREWFGSKPFEVRVGIMAAIVAAFALCCCLCNRVCCRCRLRKKRAGLMQHRDMEAGRPMHADTRQQNGRQARQQNPGGLGTSAQATIVGLPSAPPPAAATMSGTERELQVWKLKEMGFAFEPARRALEANDYDVGRALDSLQLAGI
ncbi:unnamed protein product [Polarella glacialis]|uniref:UBA domain-containing protein n=1 Tax=Polarella glacialis TaxID=89957 RepID=A0A813KF27_POLGL|nr:unnamed protein product [Polarella glacialis]